MKCLLEGEVGVHVRYTAFLNGVVAIIIIGIIIVSVAIVELAAEVDLLLDLLWAILEKLTSHHPVFVV